MEKAPASKCSRVPAPCVLVLLTALPRACLMTPMEQPCVAGSPSACFEACLFHVTGSALLMNHWFSSSVAKRSYCVLSLVSPWMGVTIHCPCSLHLLLVTGGDTVCSALALLFWVCYGLGRAVLEWLYFILP